MRRTTKFVSLVVRTDHQSFRFYLHLWAIMMHSWMIVTPWPVINAPVIMIVVMVYSLPIVLSVITIAISGRVGSVPSNSARAVSCLWAPIGLIRTITSPRSVIVEPVWPTVMSRWSLLIAWCVVIA